MNTYASSRLRSCPMLRRLCTAIATTRSSSTLGEAHVSNEVEGKPSVDLKLSDGETRFVAGNFAQVAKHLSDQLFRNATIELTQDERLRQTPSHWPEENGEKTFPAGRITTVFVKEGVRVSEVNLEPGAIVPSHHHDGPYLLVAVSVSIYAATSREWARCPESSSPAMSNGCREAVLAP